MLNRWGILALLFGARTVMAFQFQAVGAIGPGLSQVYGIGLGQIGFAIGLYFLPGIVIALPGARIGGLIGERQVVVASLAFMAAGATVMALAEGWAVFLIGQGIAGVGGVMLNILMSKMIADWFAGREIATAMSIFVNSWPVGIALSLVIMPPVLSQFGVAASFWGIAAASALFGGLIWALYHAPSAIRATPSRQWPDRKGLQAAVYSGAVWGLFNAGVAVVFSFGATLLVDLGEGLETAAARTSIVLWVMAVLSPVGGILADRMANPNLLISGGLIGLIVTIPLIPLTAGHWAAFAAVGVFGGLIPGPIMALPAVALMPAVLAAGMGVFFVIYYVTFVAAPVLGGALSAAVGGTQAAFWLGGAFEVGALISLWAYARALRQKP